MREILYRNYAQKLILNIGRIPPKNRKTTQNHEELYVKVLFLGN